MCADVQLTLMTRGRSCCAAAARWVRRRRRNEECGNADEELMLRRLKAHEDALRATLSRVLELRAAAHRCCCGIGLLECCCSLLRSSCARDEEEQLRYCADARLKMALFAGLARAMLMAMPTPVVERCAGCRGGMMVLMRDSG
jgi:hypothetical protein